MDAGFVTIIHVGSHFSLGSTAKLKLFVLSRILAEFFSLRDPNISRIFPQASVFFPIADWPCCASQARGGGGFQRRLTCFSFILKSDNNNY